MSPKNFFRPLSGSRKDGRSHGKDGKQKAAGEEEEDPLRLPTVILNADPRYRIKPMQQVMSALIGGLITTFVVTPLEVVKTRVQTQHTVRQRPTVSKLCYVFHNGLMTHVCRSCDTCVPKKGRDLRNLRPHRGSMDAFFKIICGNGFSGLWAGLSPTLVSALPSTIIYFVTYEYLKNSLSSLYLMSSEKDADRADKPREIHTGSRRDPNAARGNTMETMAPSGLALPYFVPMASGIFSRTIVVTAITPIEMVRIKMQSQVMTYAELWRVVRSLIRQHGVLGLWRGWPPTIMRDAPFSGTYWAAYESIKRTFNVTEPSFLFSFFAGAISGTMATMVTMPFDLITTHTQIELGQDVLYEGGDGISGGKNAPRSSSKITAKPSVFSRLKHIYRKQGVGGLYVGVMPRMLRVVPACAIMISTFEYSKSFFFHHNLDLKEAAYRGSR
ncbi:solute carrier family 25 protein Shawn isoform X1 [Drosophila bipectinata]|uniref:solute carrier family 25 protein Shawn isoform X1 n=2 Tax=Drosophila bipectinata TaxID=42026 RepID=UPI0038B2819E